jgi:hypothetical protein
LLGGDVFKFWSCTKVGFQEAMRLQNYGAAEPAGATATPDATRRFAKFLRRTKSLRITSRSSWHRRLADARSAQLADRRHAARSTSPRFRPSTRERLN